MENPVLIFGANNIGRLAKDIFESNDHVVYGFLDDNKSMHGTELDDVVVLGSTDDDGFLKLIGKNAKPLWPPMRHVCEKPWLKCCSKSGRFSP